MEVIVAKSAGFCFGVTRAVDTVFENLENSNNQIYTYGPIIHNKEVVKSFEEKGVIVLDENGILPDHLSSNSSIVIRSHGITRNEMENLKQAGFSIVDATCPFVKKIHTIVDKYSSEGYYIIIAGNPMHPEVIGIKGWVNSEYVSVVSSRDDIEHLKVPEGMKICLVSQTTFNVNKFEEFVEMFDQKGYDIYVLNTICNATSERQKEAKLLAASVDAMIVIGDKSSSNTQKLFEISKNECENTYYIQTSDEMDYQSLCGFRSVGITAGASTPKNIIQEVSKHVRKL